MKKRAELAVVERSSAMRKLAVAGVVVLVLAVGLSIAVAKGVFNSPASSANANVVTTDRSVITTESSPLVFEARGVGLEAVIQAAADNKYLFAFFWSSDSDQTAAMKKVFEEATAKVADRAVAVSVRCE